MMSNIHCMTYVHLLLLEVILLQQVFFSGGDWGPPGGKKFACPPPHRPPSPLFDQSLSPSTEFCLPKFQKFYLIFLSILTTF